MRAEFLDEQAKEGAERNFPRRKMSVPNVTTTDLRALLQMQVWIADRTSSSRMPVVQQNFFLIRIVERVVVTNNLHPPKSARAFRFNDTVMLLQSEHKARRPTEDNGFPVVDCKAMGNRRRVVPAGNINNGVRHTRHQPLGSAHVCVDSSGGISAVSHSSQYSGSIIARNVMSPCLS